MYVCFFKQKTASDMRISDWSSDVCSSDLRAPLPHGGGASLRLAPCRRCAKGAWAVDRQWGRQMLAIVGTIVVAAIAVLAAIFWGVNRITGTLQSIATDQRREAQLQTRALHLGNERLMWIRDALRG